VTAGPVGAALVTAGLVAVRARLLLVTVRGHSMVPTLVDRQRLLVRRTRRAPRRGEVVVFTLRRPGPSRPRDPGCLVKRVVAVPGDPLPPWVPVQRPDLRSVPEGFVVVAGDNPRSLDSRRLGLIDRRDILGVVPNSRRSTAGDPGGSAAR
jgi:signal peptidase I